MWTLAWSNLTHHKVRSALSALAVALGIMLLLVSKGLATGSIGEVAQRMQSVDAELVVLPAQDNVIFTNGAPFPGIFEKYVAKQADARGPLATAVIPVFFGQVHMGGQQQRLFGVDPQQMQLFLGPRQLVAGRLFDRAHDFVRRLAAPPETGPEPDGSGANTPPDLTDGLELVIDDRLQRVGRYALGDTIEIMSQRFRIVGIVEAGVAGRVFAPLQTLRELLNAGEPWSSMFFVKLRPDVEATMAADQLATTLGNSARVELKSAYGKLLSESFAQIDLYMTASSGLALVVCFLFILLTMYTLVLQRTREIGILKSLGVTRLGLVGLSVCEALLISIVGVGLGVGLAFGAKVLLVALAPLLTVELGISLITLAVVIGVIGGVLSALYPGYRAARLDPATALSFE